MGGLCDSRCRWDRGKTNSVSGCKMSSKNFCRSLRRSCCRSRAARGFGSMSAPGGNGVRHAQKWGCSARAFWLAGCAPDRRRRGRGSEQRRSGGAVPAGFPGDRAALGAGNEEEAGGGSGGGAGTRGWRRRTAPLNAGTRTCGAGEKFPHASLLAPPVRGCARPRHLRHPRPAHSDCGHTRRLRPTHT